MDQIACQQPWQAPVAVLCCFRGVATHTALRLLAEVGDFRRFATARELMSFLGLTPSEYSSGQQRHRGSITKTGNQHARRLVVEAAWHYRHPPRHSLKDPTRRRTRRPGARHPGVAGAASPQPPPPNARPPRQTLDRRQRRSRSRARRVPVGRDDRPTTTPGGHRCLNTPHPGARRPARSVREPSIGLCDIDSRP